MKTTFCILFICAVSYLTQKYNCLDLIDLPISFNKNSNAGKLSQSLIKTPKVSIFLQPQKPVKNLWSPVKMASQITINQPRIRYSQEQYAKPPKIPVVGIKIKTHLRKPEYSPKRISKMPYPPLRSTTPKFDIRRYFVVDHNGELLAPIPRANEYEDEKDANLKTKISTLVQQTVHDTERRIKSVQNIKDQNRDAAPYKAGFILSMIKKSRDVLNELFNVAVKHKDEWKALEQLKIFELIVHTNVDTTNLVRQLVEIHIQHLNSTNPEQDDGTIKKRVVLL